MSFCIDVKKLKKKTHKSSETQAISKYINDKNIQK